MKIFHSFLIVFSTTLYNAHSTNLANQATVKWLEIHFFKFIKFQTIAATDSASAVGVLYDIRTHSLSQPNNPLIPGLNDSQLRIEKRGGTQVSCSFPFWQCKFRQKCCKHRRTKVEQCHLVCHYHYNWHCIYSSVQLQSISDQVRKSQNSKPWTCAIQSNTWTVSRPAP